LKLRAVLLDAVGTLIHPSEAVGATYARIAREHGVDVPAWRVDDAFRRVLRSAPPMLVADDAGERAWWRELVRATFRAADQMQRFDDFEACFDALFAHFARPEAWLPRPAHARRWRAARRGTLRRGRVELRHRYPRPRRSQLSPDLRSGLAAAATRAWRNGPALLHRRMRAPSA
jgi:hypothetical protein